MENIGEKIRKLRISSGLTQTDVASVCGIKQSSYASIESGKTKNISIEVGKGIAKALAVPFTEVFEIEKNEKEFAALISENLLMKGQLDEKLQLIEKLKDEKDFTQKMLLSCFIYSYTTDFYMIKLLNSKADKEEYKEYVLKAFRLHKGDLETYINNDIVSPNQYKEVLQILDMSNKYRTINLLENITDTDLIELVDLLFKAWEK